MRDQKKHKLTKDQQAELRLTGCVIVGDHIIRTPEFMERVRKGAREMVKKQAQKLFSTDRPTAPTMTDLSTPEAALSYLRSLPGDRDIAAARANAKRPRPIARGKKKPRADKSSLAGAPDALPSPPPCDTVPNKVQYATHIQEPAGDRDDHVLFWHNHAELAESSVSPVRTALPSPPPCDTVPNKVQYATHIQEPAGDRDDHVLFWHNHAELAESSVSPVRTVY